jgi:amidase
VTFERRDAVASRDSPALRAALAKRAVVRDRIVGLLDSLRLDALVYPTIRRKAAFIGDAQLGTTCALASQSGLPALSALAGFTDDGLPIGVELIGRPWSDARLVAFAFALERSGSRRRPPSTTPALVNGAAPVPVTVAVTAWAGASSAHGRFVFDRTRSELAWQVRIAPAGRAAVQAAVLVRRESARAPHVVYRLSGPGVSFSSGTLFLDGANRRALHDGRLALSIVTNDDGTGAGNAVLTLPALARDRQ